MIEFFKKKEKEEPGKEAKQKTFQQIIHEPVLTAEGWRRKMLKKNKKK